MKFNKSTILKEAWMIKRNSDARKLNKTFGECLKLSWAKAKTEVKTWVDYQIELNFKDHKGNVVIDKDIQIGALKQWQAKKINKMAKMFFTAVA